MAKIRKRGKTYQIDYFDPTGKRVRKSFKKKKDAEAELGKRVLLIAEGRYLDVKKEYKTTLKDILTKYEENFKECEGHFVSRIGIDICENPFDMYQSQPAISTGLSAAALTAAAIHFL